MGHTNLRASENAAPVQADDLELIRGIGPGISQRLKKAGVLTFTQLAAMSPDDVAAMVAGLAGLSAERIATQNWIGQAQELAAEPLANVIPENGTEKANRQHYATFTVELLLDERNGVRRTRVAHVQTGFEESWATWDQERLVDYFIKQADLKLSQSQPVLIDRPIPGVSLEADSIAEPERASAEPDIVESEPVLASAEPDSIVESATSPELVLASAEPDIVMETNRTAEHIPAASAARYPMLPRLYNLTVATTGDTAGRKLLRANQSFDTRLTIAFEGAPQASDEWLDYSAAIYARSLDGRMRYPAGTEHGKLNVANNIVLNVGCTAMTPGLYRMEAVLSIGSDAEAHRPSAFIEGSLLQVY